MPARIRCHVLEVPTNDDWLARRGGETRGGSRELLPWADPYIAGLMRNLENRSVRHERVTKRLSHLSDPFAVAQAADMDLPSDEWQDDGWQEDAFMPRPLEAPRFHSHPPVYGEFPLLDDLDRLTHLEP